MNGSSQKLLDMGKGIFQFRLFELIKIHSSLLFVLKPTTSIDMFCFFLLIHTKVSILLNKIHFQLRLHVFSHYSFILCSIICVLLLSAMLRVCFIAYAFLSKISVACFVLFILFLLFFFY